MDERPVRFARYWRNSLADAELGLGCMTEKQAVVCEKIAGTSLLCGHIEQALLARCFHGEAAETETIAVIVRPQVYRLKTEHNKMAFRSAPAIVTPLITPALLARDGRLYPQTGTVIPRDLLEPLGRGAFALGQVAVLDSFLTREGVPAIVWPSEATMVDAGLFEAGWADYVQGCDRLLAQVCPQWPTSDFVRTDYGYLVKKQAVQGAGQHILPLYDHLGAQPQPPHAPLFATYAGETVTPAESCLPASVSFAMRLGHGSDRYPLAPAQRDALTHLLAARHGEILAVNGPPGTGKTTLLLAVVASLWARAALEGGPPPVILAASSNNQAVTNIIEAFGKDFSRGEGAMAGRWLPGIKSYGAYFPGVGQESKLADNYQTRSFFHRMEQEDAIGSARRFYLECAAVAFPSLPEHSVQAVVDTLLAEIRLEAGKLVIIEAAWHRWVEAREQVQDELGDDPRARLESRRQLVISLEVEQHASAVLAEQWDEYRGGESIVLALFAWLPAVAEKRLLLARQWLRRFWPEENPDQWQGLPEIDIAIKERVRQASDCLKEQNRRLAQGKRALESEQLAESAWKAALAVLGVEDDGKELSLDEVDTLADTLLRCRIFSLATHYWEGRWLLEMQALIPELAREKNKTGRRAMENRWRRRMMLTPCVVSTLFMLPQEMKISRHDGERYVPDYLTDFADLLIVDEAGQVLPEVAGASFALARKALVIGDTRQIEPIWSIPAAIDIGNLREAKLLPQGSQEEASYDRLAELGKTAASGSVMRIAQMACRYHQEADLERGLYLLEHRRCFDEIIGYCNVLCYRGKLIPKRGGKRDEGSGDDLPPMGYVHVNGICRQGPGGSRQNQLEAETIAAWLAERQVSLERRYRRPLHEIVGVVTPFSGQVQAIGQACANRGIAVGPREMTVGTVHALQGAERAVVLFSMVYSKHADGGFIDRSTSMLNVAVSRARDSFLLFGDMDVMQLAPADSPRGQLSRLLHGDETNVVPFEQDQPRRDLVTARTGFAHLRDAAEHDAFLLEVLAGVAREVHIVSPWLRLNCVEETGALAAMKSAVERGVRIHIYTDAHSNTTHRDPIERVARGQNLKEALDTMRRHRIEAVCVEKVHSKIVMGDANVYCVGSFNWLSASRDPLKARHETSLVYRGPDLNAEIEIVKGSLRKRVVGDEPGCR